MSETAKPARPRAYDAFLSLSAALGQDILRTQGAGGNTSLKQDGVMWMKASGTWLAHALDREIMVPVAVDPLVEALRTGDPRAEKATDFVIDQPDGGGLRPSIEASFHAAIPQPVVAHFHCVNTLALAVLERGEELVRARLSASLPDLSWAYVPYRRPGVPVALKVLDAVPERPDVLVLANHGIIVAGETVDATSQRIEAVTAALSVAPRPVPATDRAWLEKAASGSPFRVAADEATHATALCPVSLRIALGGSLYPDHVIFLGTEIGVLDDEGNVAALLAGFAARGLPAPKLLVAPGRGVLVSRALTPGGEAMARCLAEVVTRIPEGEAIRYLDAGEEHELTNWEAEQYRQALDRKAAAV